MFDSLISFGFVCFNLIPFLFSFLFSSLFFSFYSISSSYITTLMMC